MFSCFFYVYTRLHTVLFSRMSLLVSHLCWGGEFVVNWLLYLCYTVPHALCLTLFDSGFAHSLHNSLQLTVILHRITLTPYHFTLITVYLYLHHLYLHLTTPHFTHIVLVSLTLHTFPVPLTNNKPHSLVITTTIHTQYVVCCTTSQDRYVQCSTQYVIELYTGPTIRHIWGRVYDLHSLQAHTTIILY